MPDFADGAVAVVGIDVQQDRDAAGAIAFQRELLVSCARKFASAALYGALDVIRRHILSLGGNNSPAQAGIGVWIAAAILRGNADFFDQPGKNLTPLGVQSALLVL